MSDTFRIASGQPTAKWWAAFRVIVAAVLLPAYNLIAARYGWPALTTDDGTAIVDAVGVAWVAVAGVLSLVAAWWQRPDAGDAPVPDYR